MSDPTGEFPSFFANLGGKIGKAIGWAWDALTGGKGTAAKGEKIGYMIGFFLDRMGFGPKSAPKKTDNSSSDDATTSSTSIPDVSSGAESSLASNTESAQTQSDIAQSQNCASLDGNASSGESSEPVKQPTPPVVLESKRHPVPLISQEKYYWCWNACAQMIARNYGFQKGAQTEAAQAAFPGASDTNRVGNNHQINAALNYYTDGEITTNIVRPALTEGTLVSLLNDGPVVILRDHGSYWHWTVVYGYDKTDRGNVFYVRDPLPVGSGKSVSGSFGEVIDNSNGRLDDALLIRR